MDDTDTEGLAARLERAGCPPELCERALRLAEADRAAEALPNLAEQRLRVLSEVREANGKLACLDGVIDDIRRQRVQKR